jgi:hypothetical protein
VEFAETLGKVVEAPQNACTNFPQHPLVSIIIMLVVIVIVIVVIMIIIVRSNSSMNVSETDWCDWSIACAIVMVDVLVCAARA